jgi:hypothetical protein
MSVLDKAIAMFVSNGYVHRLDREDWMAAHREMISAAFGR